MNYSLLGKPEEHRLVQPFTQSRRPRLWLIFTELPCLYLNFWSQFLSIMTPPFDCLMDVANVAVSIASSLMRMNLGHHRVSAQPRQGTIASSPFTDFPADALHSPSLMCFGSLSFSSSTATILLHSWTITEPLKSAGLNTCPSTTHSTGHESKSVFLALPSGLLIILFDELSHSECLIESLQVN